MPNIDELAIELNGSSSKAETAVDNVIRALDKLKTNLNIQFGSELTTSLENLSGGLAHLNTTISGIDTAKVKDLGRALGSLSKNAGKLAGLSKFTIDTKGIQGAESAFERAFGHMSKEARDTATDLAKMYDIDPSYLDDFAKRVQALYDSKGSVSATDDLIRFIDTFGNLEKELTVNAQKAQELQKILSSGLAIPKNLKQNVPPETFRRIQGYTGIKGFKYAENAGYGNVQQFDGPTGWAQRADKVFGASGIFGKRFSDMTDASEGFVTAVDYLDKYKGEMASTSDAAEELTYRIYGISEAVKQTSSAMDKMPKGDEWMPANEADINMFDPGFVETQASSLDNLASSIQNVAQVVEVNPLEKLAEGIEKISETTSYDFSNLSTLSTAVGKLSGENVMAAAQAIPEIGKGLQSLNGIQIPNLEGLEALTTQLRGLGSKTIRGAATALPPIVQALRSLDGGVNIPNSEQIAEFGKAIAILGRQSVKNAAENLPLVADALSNAATKLSNLPEVSENTIRLATAMGQLSASSNRAGTSVGRTNNFLKMFNNTARSAHKSTKGLAATIGKIYATYWLLFRAFSKVRQAIGYASDLTEVQNVVDTVFGDARDKVQEFADTTIMTFGMSELSAKEFASRFQSMGTAMGITDKQVASANEFIGKSVEKTKRQIDGIKDSYKDLGKSTADMSINLTKLAADMGSFYNKDYAEVAEDLESVMTGMTRPLRKYGLDLTNATLKEWAMANGMKANLKTMTQAEKTMLRYQYVMANMGHVMNDYAITADTWANVTRTIGQQFQKLGQIIGQGLVNTFKPALIKFRDFLNGLIGLVEKTLNAIGKLLGWQIEITEVGLEGAEDAAEGISDGLGDAAGNAKKLNKQLAGFDELNNLTTPSDGGGSGGGTGGASGGSGGKSQASGGGVTYKPYESEIDSWRGLGEAIADTISRELDSIKWEKIYKKAEKFGTGLADFMNGLFSGQKGKKLFESLGSTIAGAVNTVMIAADTWAGKLEWSQIGENIKDGVVSFLTKWKPEIQGSAFGNFVGGLAQALYSAVSDKNAWKLLGDKIAIGINGFLSSMNKVDIKTGKTGWQALGGSIASAFSGIGTAIKEALNDIDWKDVMSGIWSGIKEFFADLTPEGVAAIIGLSALNPLKNGLVGLLTNALNPNKKGLPLTISLACAFDVLSDDGGDLGRNLIASIAAGVGAAVTTSSPYGLLVSLPLVLISTVKWMDADNDNDGLSNFTEWWHDLWTKKLKIGGGAVLGFDGKKHTIKIPISSMISEFKWKLQTGKIWEDFFNKLFNFDLAKSWADRMTEHFKNIKTDESLLAIGSDVVDGIFSGFVAALTFIVEPFYDLFNCIVDGVKDAFGIASPAKKMKPYGKYIVEGIVKGFTDFNFTGAFEKWFTGVWNDIVKWWTGEDPSLEISTKSTTTRQNVVTWYNNVKGWWDGAKKDLNIASKITTTKNNVVGWFNNVRGWWDNAKKDLSVATKNITTKANVSGWFNNIKDWWGNVKKDLKIGTNNTTTKTNVTGWYNSINTMWGVKNLSVGIKFAQNALNNLWTSLTNFFTGKKVTVGANAKNKALGGSLYNGKWHNIAQYASGGLPSHGSMFVAGEAGAEVVGHVNGRTEVLNESQLASTMYAAVSNAMSQQNAILLKQNEYLAGILSKDYGISSKDIFNATRSEATSYYNRTGRPAFQG